MGENTEPNPLETHESEFVAADLDFNREQAHALYKAGFMETNPRRWMRISEEVRFEDVVALLTGFTSMVISCPFHGRDSTPSFHIYRRGNDATCFGCPPGEQYYDSVIFTAKKLGVSRVQALRWLEKQYNLPPIEDIDISDPEDNEDEGFIELKFPDLKAPYIEFAARDIQTAKDPELAIEYLEILFDCWPSRQEAKDNPDAGDPMPLARVLGKTTLEYILARKKRK